MNALSHQVDHRPVSPIAAFQKRNRKIRALLVAVAAAVVSALFALAAPELGLAAAGYSLAAAGVSVTITLAAKRMNT
jgi:hypothetical protein